VTSASSFGEELLAALTLAESDDASFRAPHVGGRRGVVFGGQMLGQAIVAASRRMPDKRLKSLQTVFTRGANVADPVDIFVEPMQDGRTFGSSTVTFVQGDRVCARALALLDVSEPDLIHHHVSMPDVAPPDSSKALPNLAAAPETIIVGDVDVRAPALVGPPTLQLWVRFPGAPPDDAAIARALLAHATDGWLIATAMRPHKGIGQSMAHDELSTTVLSHALAFHDDFSADEWLLIDHESQAAGGGRAYGRGHVFTEEGRLVASFVQEALLRRAPEGDPANGKSATKF
jgi:acyl-CoA thioesterase-2